MSTRISEIRLKPDLEHCVVTVAKREYERVLPVLLKSNGEDEQLADELELLRFFLESADFAALRCQCEETVLGGKQVVARLVLIDGMPECIIEKD
jgi:hypothetical protein